MPLDVALCGSDYACIVNVRVSEQLDQVLATISQLDLAVKYVLVAILAVISVVTVWKFVRMIF